MMYRSNDSSVAIRALRHYRTEFDFFKLIWWAFHWTILVISLNVIWYFTTIARNYYSTERMHEVHRTSSTFRSIRFVQRKIDEITNEICKLVDHGKRDLITSKPAQSIFQFDKKNFCSRLGLLDTPRWNCHWISCRHFVDNTVQYSKWQS